MHTTTKSSAYTLIQDPYAQSLGLSEPIPTNRIKLVSVSADECSLLNADEWTSSKVDQASNRLRDLPRELRDHILHFALNEKETALNVELAVKNDGINGHVPEARDGDTSESDKPRLRASIRNRASTNILLACQSLSTEYEDRARQAMVLILRDSDRYAFQCVILPDWVKGAVRTLELHLILFDYTCHLSIPPPYDESDCQATQEVSAHRTWVEDVIAQMTSLKSLYIDAYLSTCPACTEDKEKKLPCGKLVEAKLHELRRLPKLKALTLYKYKYKEAVGFDGPKHMIREWSAKEEKRRGPTTPEESK